MIPENIKSPQRSRSYRSFGFAAAALALLTLASGCKPPAEGGNDMEYLTATPYTGADLPNKASDNLLPLTPGNYWQMISLSERTLSHDTIAVVGPATPPNGIASTQIDLKREGKPWRTEYYKSGDGLYLTAVKDETSPLMTFSTPVPLVKYGFQEGQEFNWAGTVRIGDKPAYPATSLSRMSGVEQVKTKAGPFKVCRIDTIVVVMIDGHPIRFPSVRWLAPGVGFVRRGFADKGHPASSELEQFNVH